MAQADIYISGRNDSPIRLGVDAGVLIIRSGWADFAAEEYRADNPDAATPAGAIGPLGRASVWLSVALPDPLELGIEGTLFTAPGEELPGAFGGIGYAWIGVSDQDAEGWYRTLRFGPMAGTLSRFQCDVNCSTPIEEYTVFSRSFYGLSANIEVGKTLRVLPVRFGLKVGAHAELPQIRVIGFDVALALSFPY